MAHCRKILIVGAGITGSILALELKRLFANSLLDGSLSVAIWEKAKETGGRMMTLQCPGHPACQADLGTQYISRSKEKNEYDRFYKELQRCGLLEPMTAAIDGDNPYSGAEVDDLVALLGMASLVQHFLTQSGIPVSLNCEINALKSTREGKICVSTISRLSQEFDAVILTMPLPQILDMTDCLPSLEATGGNRSPTKGVAYSSRYTLALFFPDHTDINLNFGFKFVKDDDVIRYVAVDNIKRGRPNAPAALVVHSTWQFAVKFPNDSDDSFGDVTQLMTERVYRLFPQLPPTTLIKLHRWKYAQVRHQTDSDFSAGCFVVNETPLIVCAGDSFTDSSFEGCLQSALAATSYVKSFLDKST